MSINVKVLERPVGQVSYVRATLKGMALTFKHLIDPHKVTVQYPEEKWPISPRWRGTHRMLTTETGKAKCVACGLCLPRLFGAAAGCSKRPSAVTPSSAGQCTA